MLKRYFSYLTVFLLFTVFMTSAFAQKDEGINAVKKGDFKRGLEILKPVVATNKDYDPNVYYAIALFNTGNLTEAEKYFNVALADDDEGVLAYKGLGDIYTAQKKFDAAQPKFDRALKFDSKNVPTLISYAIMYKKKGEVDKEIEKILTAQIYEPDNLTLTVMLGDAYLDRESPKVAIPYYQKAISVNSRFAPAYYGMAQAYRMIKTDDKEQKAKNYQESLNNLNKAIEYDVNYKDAYYEKGKLLFLWDKYEESYEAMKKYLEFDPKDGYAKSICGRSMYKLKKYDKALEYFNDIIQNDTNKGIFSEANLLSARILMVTEPKDSSARIENAKQMVKYYSAVTADDLGYGDYLNTAYCYNIQNDSANVEKVYASAFSKYPDESDIYFNYGKFLAGHDAWDLAQKSFQNAINKGKIDIIGYLYNGLAFYHLKQYEKAIKELENSIAIFEKTPETTDDVPYAYDINAKCYTLIGNKEKAIENYEKSLKLDPNNVDDQNAIKALKQ